MMDPITFARIWMAVRPFKRLKERREAKRAAESAGLDTSNATPPTPEVGHPPEHVEAVIQTAAAVKGGLRSKMVWLGVVQMLAGIAELYINGTLSAESAAPLLSGFLIVALRAITGESLADKGTA